MPLRLRIERIAADKLQRTVARESHVDEANYSRIERGLTVPYDPEIKRIADVLDWKGDPRALLEEVPAVEIAAKTLRKDVRL